MTPIEIAAGGVQVDAQVLADAFRITQDDLKAAMRDGTITSQYERGEDEDAGKFRLTFFSAERRVRMIADAQGNVLTCSTVQIGNPAASLPAAKG